MRFRIIHYGRKWRRADNHMDCRHCPDCGCTVNGSYGQNAHEQWHGELAELLESLSERAGIEPDQGPAWTAVLDESEPEAIDG